jgi:alanine dehydrogenase
MLIGVLKEIKNHEYRVSITPAVARQLVSSGHRVIVETQAGTAIGLDDEQYWSAGAQIVDRDTIFQQAELIVKVKEPQPEECRRLREGQVLFTYLHLAPDPVQARLLLASGCIAIAYETITDERGGLPLLAPMSEVAGRISVQAGAHHLQTSVGGRGVLLGGATGVAPAEVVILGGGVVGTNAARIAVGMGAQVSILDKSLSRLKELDALFSSQLRTLYATVDAVEQAVLNADLVIGAVLLPGASAPKLIQQDLLPQMRPGGVIVDVSIDQGGCFETSRPTTHEQPTFVVDSVIHYCVANMPSAVPRTSTFALSHATYPYIAALADKGYRQALLEDPHLSNGLNVYQGQLTHKAVANDLGENFTPTQDVLNQKSFSISRIAAADRA